MATFTATYTLTQADLDHGSVADSATATGTPPSGTPITSSPSTATVTATQTPALTVVKSVTSTGPYNTVGQTVTYQFVAKNTGNVTLTTVGINDTQTAPAGALTSGPTCTGLTTPTATCSGSSTTLAPGQSATFTATYTLTQADLNNGSVNDSATATGTPPTGSPITSSPSTASVTVAQSPALTVVKSVTSTGPYNTVGQTVTYQFVAKNTGNVTLTTVGINDTQTAPAGALTSGPTCTGLTTPTATCSGSSTTLLPGQSATFTATYTLTQADLNNGSVADSATASGTPPTGSPITSAPSTATVTIAQAPTLTVTKTSTTADVQSVGQVVPYTFVAKNTGNVTLTGVGITDTQTAPSLNTSLSAITCQSLATPTATCSGSTTTLLPGQSATFAANYTVTAADLTHGSVADSATATGTPPIGSPVTSPPATLSLPAATLTVAKSVTSTGPYNTVGQTVTYKFVATNTGTTSLTGVSITDTQTAPSLNTSLSAITCQSLATPTATCSGTSTTLAAGQSATFTATYTLTQADLDHGSVADSATATGTPPSGTPITSSPSTATVTATQTPALTVVKSVTSTGPYNTVGQTVTYQFVAKNTGNVTLTTVGINDTQTAPAGALTSGPTCTGLTTPTATCSGSSTTLAPGQSATFTATYTLTQADLNNGSVNDSATATGTPPTGSPITSSPSTASVTVAQSPALTVVKSVTSTGPYNTVGQTVTYQFVAKNTGNVTLTTVGINDTQTAPAGALTSGPTCTGLTTPTATCSGSSTTLLPGQSATFTATYTLTQADLNNGSVADSATASGTPPTGSPITSAPSTATVTIAQAPTLTVTKTSTTADVQSVGQVVPYTFVATNTGNVTLTGVGITDTQTAPSLNTSLSAITCQSLATPTATCSGSTTTLLPGQSATFAANYTVTAADLTHGSVADSATATGTPPTGSPVTSPPATLSLPAATLTVAKSVTSTGPYNTVGQTVTYKFVATNTGTTSLTGVSITDTQTAPSLNTSLSAITCQSLATPTATCSGTSTTLAAGQSATFTATYTLTQADLDHGSVADSATATGTPPSGTPITSSPSTATVTATQTPALTVVKSVTSTGPYNTVGQTVTYQFVAKNTGNVTLTTVGINDTQTAPAGALTSGPTCTGLTTPTATCSGSSTTLAPGQSATFTATYTLTQADLNNGSVNDSATATGTPPTGSPITSSPSTASVTVAQSPALTVVKSVTSTGPYNTVGQTVAYQFVATNTGNVTLTGVSVADTQTAPAGSLASGPTCTGLATPTASCSGSTTTLAPGQSATFVATYLLTQADLNNGSVHDSATASGTPPTGPVVTSTPSTATVPVAQTSALTVLKSVTSTGPYNTVGQTVTYQFVAKNTGNVTLTTVGINDTQTAPAGSLASGPTCTGLATPTATCSGSSTTLAPGQSATFTATYTLTQADLNNGSVADSATASGTPPTGPVVTSAPSTATVPTAQSTGITVLKSVTSTGPYNAVGQTVAYQFVATNTGNVTLTGVSVADTQTAPAGSLASGPTCTGLATPTASCSGSTTTLAPGQSATFVATYLLTQADLNNGSVHDSATASGTPPTGPVVTSTPSTATVPVAQTSALTVLKSVTSTGPYKTVGQTVAYQFVATNTGNVTLTGVSVADTQTAPAGSLDLRPHLHRPGHPDGLLLGLDHHPPPRAVGHLRRHLPPHPGRPRQRLGP